MKIQVAFLLITVFILGCKTDSSNSENKTKDVGELGYSEIVDAVITGAGEPVEYHGEQTNSEALGDIQLVKSENSCDQNDCGMQYVVKNKGTRTVKLLTYSAFQVGFFDSYAARFFTLNAGDEAVLGCSDFCYDSKKYAFDHQVISAEFID